MNIAVFKTSTGQFVFIGSVPTVEAAAMQPDGPDEEVLLDIEATFNDYVLNGAVTPRPEMPITQDGNTLTVPAETEFSIRSPVLAHGISDDGVLEFEFSEPGTYTILLIKWPYLDKEIILESHS